MSGVRYTDKPSEAIPGEIIGQPIRLPHVMLCHAAGPGQRGCGTVWTANTREQFFEKAAERRTHEATCKGGLIVAGG